MLTRKEAMLKIGELGCYARANGWDDDYTQAVNMAIKALEQEPCEDAVSRQGVIDALYELCDARGTLKENPWRDNPHIDAVIETIEQLPSVNQKEPKYCDRNICVQNEYNSIGCENCEVTKSQAPKTGRCTS